MTSFYDVTVMGKASAVSRICEARPLQRQFRSTDKTVYQWNRRQRPIGAHHRSRPYSWRPNLSNALEEIGNLWKRPATAQPGIFPSGKKQPQLDLPALIIRITVLEAKTKEIDQRLGACLRGGITSVVLTQNPQNDNVSAGDLYEAAVKLQEILRDRATLLILARSDVAEAVSANGVVLTEDSIPLTVARQLLRDKSVILGKTVTKPEDVQAIASDGAAFVFLQRKGASYTAAEIQRAREKQRGGRIPVVPVIDHVDRNDASRIQQLLTSGIDGVCITLDLVGILGSICDRQISDSDLQSATEAILKSINLGNKLQTPTTEAPPKEKEQLPPRRLLLTEGRERMLSREKTLLAACLEVLERVSPEVEERTLLEAAMKQLDELFLVVVVGEYNSGKSSVINALLGSHFLDEGILPTTNEISVLRYTDDAPTVTILPDGVVERTLPAALLQEINIVDTPGTNVVLERQQRLTEEYVPRADMVLFVLSSDRPFTESEVRFLEYIRKWGKKVIFVVNKIDILASESDVETVKDFVSRNARRMLNLNEAFVWPVSARRALDAKLTLGNSSFGGMYQQTESDALERDERWRSSGFGSMERFVAEFFSGLNGAASAESIRLKLQTPIYVADALLDASRRQLKNERFAAEKDVAATKAVAIQLEQFSKAMKKDGKIQQQSAKKLLEKVASRAEAFIDETLLVSNFLTLRSYLSETTSISGTPHSKLTQGFTATVLGNASQDLIDIVEQQSAWMKKNCDNQVTNYHTFAENCARQFDRSLDEIMLSAEKEAGGGGDSTETTAQLPASQTLTNQELISGALQKKLPMDVVFPSVVEDPAIGVSVCEQLVETEIREAVNATGGTAIAAIGVGCVLTLVLPTTAEDILALSISFLIGYVALLNLPLRRGEIKSRIRKIAESAGVQMEKLLEARLSQSLSETSRRVQNMIQPLEILFQNELKRVMDNEKERNTVAKQLDIIKSEILNIE